MATRGEIPSLPGNSQVDAKGWAPFRLSSITSRVTSSVLEGSDKATIANNGGHFYVPAPSVLLEHKSYIDAVLSRPYKSYKDAVLSKPPPSKDIDWDFDQYRSPRVPKKEPAATSSISSSAVALAPTEQVRSSAQNKKSIPSYDEEREEMKLSHPAHSKRAGKQSVNKRQIIDVDEPQAGRSIKRHVSNKFESAAGHQDSYHVDEPESPSNENKESRTDESGDSSNGDDEVRVGEAMADIDELMGCFTPVPNAPEDNPYMESKESIEAQIEGLLKIQNADHLEPQYPDNDHTQRLHRRLLHILNRVVDKVKQKSIQNACVPIKLSKWFAVIDPPRVVDVMISAMPEKARQVLGEEVIRVQDLIEIQQPSKEDRTKWGVYIDLIRVLETLKAFYVGSSYAVAGIGKREDEHIRQANKQPGDRGIVDSCHYRYIREWKGQCNFRHIALFDNDDPNVGIVLLTELLIIILTKAFNTSSENKASELAAAKDMLPDDVQFDPSGLDGLNRCLFPGPKGSPNRPRNWPSLFNWTPAPLRGPCSIPDCSSRSTANRYYRYPSKFMELEVWNPEQHQHHRKEAAICGTCCDRIRRALNEGRGDRLSATGYNKPTLESIPIPTGTPCARAGCTNVHGARPAHLHSRAISDDGTISLIFCSSHKPRTLTDRSAQSLLDWAAGKKAHAVREPKTVELGRVHQKRGSIPPGTPCARIECTRVSPSNGTNGGFNTVTSDDGTMSLAFCKSCRDTHKKGKNDFSTQGLLDFTRKRCRQPVTRGAPCARAGCPNIQGEGSSRFANTRSDDGTVSLIFCGHCNSYKPKTGSAQDLLDFAAEVKFCLGPRKSGP